jgi:uncharacterized NAD(P)/FAD-binding protein YdhS
MSSLLDIGIVGAGAASVCLLDALSRREFPPGSLTVFEQAAHLWRGRPYQPDGDAVRVNAIPPDMSIRGGNDQHFADWLTARGLLIGAPTAVTDPRSGAQFVPRAVYGDYLEQSARAALSKLASQGWRIDLVRDRVVDATVTTRRVALHTAGGGRHEVGTVVLGVGAGKPADLYSLGGTAGFIAEPYPVRTALADIDPDAEVSIIGSGLTAVDVVLTLHNRGHRGRIRLHSRHGVLPGVRQRPADHCLRHFTPGRFRALAVRGVRLSLRDVIADLGIELSAAGESFVPLNAELYAMRHGNPVSRLRRNLADVDSPSLALRILQQAVPEAGPDVFPLLSEADQTALVATHNRALMSLCCPMPPASAATVLSLLDAGQLEIVAGLAAVRPAGGGLVLESGPRSDRADVVVNAVNARLRQVNEDAGDLVGALARAGLARPHPITGIQVERATSRALTANGPDSRVYALGDLAAGSLFFTFGIQSLVDRVVDIAAHLAAVPHPSDDALLPV